MLLCGTPVTLHWLRAGGFKLRTPPDPRGGAIVSRETLRTFQTTLKVGRIALRNPANLRGSGGSPDARMAPESLKLNLEGAALSVPNSCSPAA